MGPAQVFKDGKGLRSLAQAHRLSAAGIRVPRGDREGLFTGVKIENAAPQRIDIGIIF